MIEGVISLLPHTRRLPNVYAKSRERLNAPFGTNHPRYNGGSRIVTKYELNLALVGLFRLRINAGRAIDKINRYTAWTTPSVPKSS